jgi:hypothetical protein
MPKSNNSVRRLTHRTILFWLLVALSMLSAVRIVATEAINVTRAIKHEIATLK